MCATVASASPSACVATSTLNVTYLWPLRSKQLEHAAGRAQRLVDARRGLEHGREPGGLRSGAVVPSRPRRGGWGEAMASNASMGPAELLRDVRVVEVAGSLAAAVCGRALSDAGADVTLLRAGLGAPADEQPLARAALDLPKRPLSAAGAADRERALAAADVVVLGGHPSALAAAGVAPARLRALAPAAVVAAITPFGHDGPAAKRRATDLVAFHASGLARILLGPVEDPRADPPVRAAGEQSAFVAGSVAALAVALALAGRERGVPPPVVDVSVQEAVAAMATRELAMPAFGGVPSRTRTPGQIGLTYVIPAADGHVAISPREAHQWRAWLEAMGSPAWAGAPEFADRAGRMEHGDRLIAHIGAWSAGRTRAELFALAQAAHVPCFPVSRPADVLREPQFAERGFFADATVSGAGEVRVPTRPYRVTAGPAPVAAAGARAPAAPPAAARALPLAGVRVVDFSWVIAGPTCTRYLAAMGADVIKVEAPDRPDPGRGSELHAVLGASKRSVALDLKAPGAFDAVRRLVAASDVVVENFAGGVMERLGLDYASLVRERPDLVMLSASGMGRTGPLAHAVAYGTLLQCFTGFSGLNGSPGRPPAAGFAWADPLSAIMMATAIAAALRARARTGRGCHIDFSMAEALLWTMPGTLLEAQQPGAADPAPWGNASRVFAPHGLYAAAGFDRWVAIGVTSDEEWRALCRVVPELERLAALDVAGRRAAAAEIDAVIGAWAGARAAADAAAALQAAGVPSAESVDTQQLFEDAHLDARGFFTLVDAGGGVLRLPGLPWRADGAAAPRLTAAPELGADTETVLAEVVGLDGNAVARLRAAGAFGSAAADMPPMSARP